MSFNKFSENKEIFVRLIASNKLTRLEISKELNIGVNTVTRWIKRLESDAGIVCDFNSGRLFRTREQLNSFISLYPTKTNKQLAEIFI